MAFSREWTVLLTIIFLATSNALPAQTPDSEPDKNLYWPGEFETRFEGGIFSSVLNGEITRAENRTPGGSGSWQINPGYQLLELLVSPHSVGVLRFHAMTDTKQTVILKVIEPSEDAADGKKTTSRDYPVTLDPSGKWEPYEIAFETGPGFPKPLVSELLVTSFNAGDASFFIDDLTVTMAEEESNWTPVITENFLSKSGGSPLVVGSKKNASAPASRGRVPLDLGKYAGKRVRVSADVTFLSLEGEFKPWSAILFVLQQPNGSAPTVLSPEGDWPFWCPIGQAGRPGQPKRVSAEYLLPQDAGQLILEAQAQPGIGDNLAQLGEVEVAVQEEE